MTDIEERWYWDRRNRKAYYPVDTDGETVTMVSVWHQEEVEDARAAEALEPLEAVSEYRDETAMTITDSFRTPADPLPEDTDE